MVPTVFTKKNDFKNLWYLEYSGYLKQLCSTKHYIYLVYVEFRPIFLSAECECSTNKAI
jgi:hypothetical protein